MKKLRAILIAVSAIVLSIFMLISFATIGLAVLGVCFFIFIAIAVFQTLQQRKETASKYENVVETV
jgi:hypothetical protein